MRVCAGLGVLALAGCATEATPQAADPAAMQRVCAEAVATHVGKGVDAVTTEWAGLTAEGSGFVLVRDEQGAGGERLHTCEVDLSGRVLAIRHPGA